MNLQERVDLKKANRDNLYTLEPTFPYSNFLIELSNACNHKCIFCTHQKMKRSVGKMTLEMSRSVLQQAYDLGTREVGFYATGEPFIVPELAEHVRIAKDIGFTYVYLTTNGSLATPEKIKAVVDSGLDSLKFSINAPERELYAFIHGHDDFDKVVEHLKYAAEYRKTFGKNYKLYITGIMTRYTEHTKDTYFEVFKDLADEIVFKDVYNQGGNMPEIDELLRCCNDDETYRRCNLPFDSIYITHEGYLSVCNADYENMLVVADLNTTSLKDGWYGEKMKSVRQMFLDDDMRNTVCNGCVHHKKLPASPLMPEYATINVDLFNDEKVRGRLRKAGYLQEKLVYVPMAADIIHPGHINIIKSAAALGRVMVGLFTDDAISEYKPKPYMDYEQRKIVIENIKGVDIVVAQESRDYSGNLKQYQPDYMVHGTDWRTGPLSDVRQKAIDLMQSWGGIIVEPEYTKGVSSSEIKKGSV